MADNERPTYTAAQVEEMLAEAEAKGRSEESAKEAMKMYALYVLQRHRIMCNRSRVCRSCTAWYHTHLEDFGY